GQNDARRTGLPLPFNNEEGSRQGQAQGDDLGQGHFFPEKESGTYHDQGRIGENDENDHGRRSIIQRHQIEKRLGPVSTGPQPQKDQDLPQRRQGHLPEEQQQKHQRRGRQKPEEKQRICIRPRRVGRFRKNRNKAVGSGGDRHQEHSLYLFRVFSRDNGPPQVGMFVV